MLKPRIIDRYVAAEIVGPFVMGAGLLTFALVTGKLLKLNEMVVNHGVGLGQVMSLIGFIMPAFLELTFPMAVLLVVLLSFARMLCHGKLGARGGARRAARFRTDVWRSRAYRRAGVRDQPVPPRSPGDRGSDGSLCDGELVRVFRAPVGRFQSSGRALSAHSHALDRRAQRE